MASGSSLVTGRVCGGAKASAASALASPKMDSYHVDVLAHEISHQFGAGHTWSGYNNIVFRGDCSAEEFQSRSAVEPGSGSSIMGFAGKCGALNDIESSADPYFALVSLEQIRRFSFTLNLFNDTSCGLDAPAVFAPKLVRGLGFPQGQCAVPSGTGFVLAPRVKDIIVTPERPEGLSYSWEQADLTSSRRTIITTSHPTGAIFRSQLPTNDPVRYFPNLATIFAGASQRGEPQFDWNMRDFRFSLTVRDVWQIQGHPLDTQAQLNNGRGGYAAEHVTVTVTDVGAFRITAEVNSNQTEVGVTWTQAAAPVLANNGASSNAFVSVSYDKGITFRTGSMFAFTAGEARVPIKSCDDGETEHKNMVVKVEVESVKGCSFYAVSQLAPINCPVIALPTFMPTLIPTTAAPTTATPTLTPTFVPTIGPSESPTFSPTLSPTYSPTVSPTGPSSSPTSAPTVTSEDDGTMTVIIAVSSVGVLVALGGGVMMLRKRAKARQTGGGGGHVADGSVTSFASLPPKSEELL
jgi:hypothetical protein